MKDKTAIGARFKKLREYFELSQEKFSQKLNITQQTYSLIEKGKRLPNFKIIQILLDDFKVNLNWLVGNRGNMFREPIESLEQYQKASKELRMISDRIGDILKTID